MISNVLRRLFCIHNSLASCHTPVAEQPATNSEWTRPAIWDSNRLRSTCARKTDGCHNNTVKRNVGEHLATVTSLGVGSTATTRSTLRINSSISSCVLTWCGSSVSSQPQPISCSQSKSIFDVVTFFDSSFRLSSSEKASSLFSTNSFGGFDCNWLIRDRIFFNLQKGVLHILIGLRYRLRHSTQSKSHCSCLRTTAFHLASEYSSIQRLEGVV